MSGRLIIISNNPRIFALNLPEWERLELSGSARKVLEAARDRIHLGWRLLHHPLYGNFRPHQQPYRTIILEDDSRCGTAQRTIDNYSLDLIEAALGIYQSQKVLTPENAPDVLLKDCSLIDFELMRATLSQSGWTEQP